MSTLVEILSGPWGPVVIFCLRIVDVSLSTVRMLLMVRNARKPVFFIAIAENLVWLSAVGTALSNLSSPWHILGYASGFATGNLVGLWIEEKLAYGHVEVRVITRKAEAAMAQHLREAGYGVTEITGQGMAGAVSVLLVIAKRREVERLLKRIRQKDGDAFITIEEPKAIRQGWLFDKRRK